MKSYHRLSRTVLALAAQAAAGGAFTLSSPQHKNGGTMGLDRIFNAFGCTGKNIPPKRVWSNPPADTRSFALPIYDPDAPTGSGWWHWVVFDIPASTRSLSLDASARKAVPAMARRRARPAWRSPTAARRTCYC